MTGDLEIVALFATTIGDFGIVGLLVTTIGDLGIVGYLPLLCVST